VLKRRLEIGRAPGAPTAAISKRHPADILHLYFTGFLSPYRGGALAGVAKVCFTDQGSHP
jgi:hypothetical protein